MLDDDDASNSVSQVCVRKTLKAATYNVLLAHFIIILNITLKKKKEGRHLILFYLE